MYRPTARNIVPSRSALRILRRLALAGSTASAIGSVCTVATISYEVNRRVNLAEHLVEQKRTLESSCPNYNTSGRGQAVDKMMEAAAAGEFFGLESMKRKPSPTNDRNRMRKQMEVSSHRNTKASTTSNKLPEKADVLGYMFPVSNDCALPRDFTKKSMRQDPPHSGPHPFSKQGGLSPNPVDPVKFDDWISKVEKHLEQNRSAEATHHFLRPPKEDYIEQNLETLKKLASRIFTQNLKERNISLANGVFRWEERNAAVSSASWEALIQAQSSKQSADSLADLYLRYADRFTLSLKLRAPVLRALIASFRLSEAKDLLFKYLEFDKTCGLCALYLGGLYAKSRNPILVETQAGELASSLLKLGIPPTEKLFNPLLEAYVESGYDQKAHILINEMQSIYNIDIGLRPLGLLAYGKALKSDWQAVQGYLDQMHDLKLDNTGRKNFTRIFDRIFLEFFLGNSGESIQSFVFDAIAKYDLFMDDILFEHILIAFIQKGTMEMVDHLLKLAESKSWNLESNNREHFLNLLRNHRVSCEKGTVGLWRMFRSSQLTHGVAGASRKLLGFDRDSFPLEEAYRFPGTGEATTWSNRINSVQMSPRTAEKFVSLRKRMIHSLNAGRIDEALEMYRVAKASGKFMKPIHIELAVVASVIREESSTEARRILEEAKATYPEMRKSQLGGTYKQMFEVGSREKAVKMAVLSFYRILSANTIPIKHHMLSSACAALIKSSRSGIAIRIIRAVNKDSHGSTVPFDAVSVKMIARASAATGNRRGIRWAIMTALSRSSALSRNLVAEIHRLVEYLRHQTERQSTEAVPPTDETRQLELEYLDYLANLLDQKEATQGGDKGNISAMPAKGNKSYTFSVTVNPVTINPAADEEAARVRTTGLAQTLANWCERSELEAALGKYRKGPLDLDGYIGSSEAPKTSQLEAQAGHG